MKTRYIITTNPHYMRYHQWVERLEQMYDTNNSDYCTIYDTLHNSLEESTIDDRDLFFDAFYDSDEICKLLVENLNIKRAITPEIMMAITLYCYETE